MGFGNIARIAAGLIVAAQIIVTIVLALAVPLPQAMASASEPEIKLEANDIAWDASVEDEFDRIGDQEEGEETADAPSPSVPSVSFAHSASASAFPADQPQQAYQSNREGIYTPDELRVLGVIDDGRYRYTWYSQRVLPGGGLAIEGRHVSDDGYVVDGQERIVVASSDLAKGTEIDIPFGSGKAVVLDAGCASGTIDVYTDF